MCDIDLVRCVWMQYIVFILSGFALVDMTESLTDAVPHIIVDVHVDHHMMKETQKLTQ